MTRRLAQSAAYTVMLKLFLSSDHATAATGKTVAITISKAGGAFGNPAAGASNATEVASGWYKFALGTGDTDTLGDLVVRGTATACDDTEQVTQVVSATTGGASNLDVASSTLATAANLATAAGYIDTEVATIVTQTSAASIRTAVGLASANLDTQLDALPTNAELATALGTADDAVLAQVALVKAKTDNLPSDPADASDIATRFTTLDTSIADLPTNAELATALGTADDAVLAQVALVKAKTDSLTFTVAGQLDANIQYVNDVQVNGVGTAGNPWSP
jgi:hypothetical protein